MTPTSLAPQAQAPSPEEYKPFVDAPDTTLPPSPSPAPVENPRRPQALAESCNIKERDHAAVEMHPARIFAILANQITTLNQMFERLVPVGVSAQLCGNEQMYERYMRLALRAQAQTSCSANMLMRLYKEQQPDAGAGQQPKAAVPKPAAPRAPVPSPQSHKASAATVVRPATPQAQEEIGLAPTRPKD